MKIRFAALFVLLAGQFGFAATLRLEDLPLSGMRQDWGNPSAGKSVQGNPFSIGGKTFDHGVGTHASSTWWIDLDGAAERFTASVGVDDEVSGDPASAARPSNSDSSGTIKLCSARAKCAWATPPGRSTSA